MDSVIDESVMGESVTDETVMDGSVDDQLLRTSQCTDARRPKRENRLKRPPRRTKLTQLAVDQLKPPRTAPTSAPNASWTRNRPVCHPTMNVGVMG